jgi:hypothetical protein
LEYDHDAPGRGNVRDFVAANLTTSSGETVFDFSAFVSQSPKSVKFAIPEVWFRSWRSVIVLPSGNVRGR